MGKFDKFGSFDKLGSDAYWKEDDWLKTLRKDIGANTLKRLKKEQLVQEIINLRQSNEEQNSCNRGLNEENKCLKFVIRELQMALRASNGVQEPVMTAEELKKKYVGE